jgi:5-methyltetrahydropteroyltriglutamate--homocysteine methyltransferase
MLFPTTIAGSLPKPEWLAEPNTLWAPWKSSGDELARAKRDATMLAVKLQEDAGVDIVTEGEQSRQHFVHGFLESRRHRFRPQGRDGHPQRPLQGDGAAGGGAAAAEGPRPCRRGAHRPRPHQAQAEIHPARPDDHHRHHRRRHYGDRVKMAFAFAELLNEEAKALQADGVDVIQFDEPAFNVYMDEVSDWGIKALERAAEGLTCATAVHICYGYGIKANTDWKADARRRVAAVRGDLSGDRQKPDPAGRDRMPQFARCRWNCWRCSRARSCRPA